MTFSFYMDFCTSVFDAESVVNGKMVFYCLKTPSLKKKKCLISLSQSWTDPVALPGLSGVTRTSSGTPKSTPRRNKHFDLSFHLKPPPSPG